MRVFAENNNNDIYLDGNRLAINVDLDATLQASQAAVELQQGEALYSILRGVPTVDVVWIRTNIPQFEYFAKKQINAVDGVVGVDTFETELAGETLKYRAVINTIYGVGAINGAI